MLTGSGLRQRPQADLVLEGSPEAPILFSCLGASLNGLDYSGLGCGIWIQRLRLAVECYGRVGGGTGGLWRDFIGVTGWGRLSRPQLSFFLEQRWLKCGTERP